MSRAVLHMLAAALNAGARAGYRMQVAMQDGRVVFRMAKVSGVTTEDQVMGTVRWDPESEEWKVEE